ncbi:MAG: hypothetical protein GXO93_07605 [FCB group bacterium]|nr:hypothetical protein [FCB group bacterium]
MKKTTHTNYFEIESSSYFDLGLKEGHLFKKQLVNSIQKSKQHKSWSARLRKSKEYLKPTIETFPDLIEELKGYAKGAGVLFEELWALNLEDEVLDGDRCTTVIVNSGKFMAHNEDWEANSKDAICVLKKSINDFTILELFYYNTLGGNSISVNSHGVVQSINTLTHTDQRVGIPRNIIARWLSETKSPQKDYWKFSTLQRSAGYSHNFVNLQGEVWNIEASAFKQKLSRITSPFVHTNHYLTKLKELGKDDNLYGTFDRYEFASINVKKFMSLDDLQNLMSNESKGKKISVFNERTIARMIVDLEKLVAYIWLLREPEKEWVEYDIGFLKS